MRTDITPEELAERISGILALRSSEIDPSQPNLRFCATLDRCDDSGTYLRCHTYGWMSNPNRTVHGGMIAAILDTSMGTVCCALYEGGFTPTITMTINYARPVPLDTDIIVRVCHSYAGTGSAQLSAELLSADDAHTILATASGVYHTAQADTLKLNDIL